MNLVLRNVDHVDLIGVVEELAEEVRKVLANHITNAIGTQLLHDFYDDLVNEVARELNYTIY